MNVQDNEQINAPADAQENAPEDIRENAPVDTQENAPADAQENILIDDRENVPADVQPEAPVNSPAPEPVYGQAPPPVYGQAAPPPVYNQAPPPQMYNQTPPQQMYNQTPPPVYNQAPPQMYNQATPQAYYQAPPPYYQAPPMQPPAKKISRAVLGATMAATFIAVMTLVSWFLPLRGHSVGFDSYHSQIFEYDNILGFSFSDPMVCIYAGLSVLNIVFAAIPKKWAAAVGLVISVLCAAGAVYLLDIHVMPILHKSFYEGFPDTLFSPYNGIGIYCILPFALFAVIWSIVKLICTARDKKRSRMNAGG